MGKSIVHVETKFIPYDDKRDVVFFFGAGASYANGIPLQKDLLPLITGLNVRMRACAC